MRSILMALAFLASLDVHAQPTLYIVRHAEKLDGWPEQEFGLFHPLSEQGVQRANRLAQWFEGKPLAAVFSSPTTRALHTAFPISQATGIPLQSSRALMDTSAIEEFLGSLATHYSDTEAVLLVTHSNIIPYILINVGLTPDCFAALDIRLSTQSRWLLAEPHENIYIVRWDDATRMGCVGISVEKF